MCLLTYNSAYNQTKSAGQRKTFGSLELPELKTIGLLEENALAVIIQKWATLKSGITGHCFTNTESKKYPKHS